MILNSEKKVYIGLLNRYMQLYGINQTNIMHKAELTIWKEYFPNSKPIVIITKRAKSLNDGNYFITNSVLCNLKSRSIYFKPQKASSVIINGNVFCNNSIANDRGGTVYCENDVNLIVRFCCFGNCTHWGTLEQKGGVIFTALTNNDNKNFYEDLSLLYCGNKEISVTNIYPTQQQHVISTNFSYCSALRITTCSFHESQVFPLYKLSYIFQNSANAIATNYLKVCGSEILNSYVNNSYTGTKISLINLENNSSETQNITKCLFINNTCSKLFNRGTGKFFVLYCYIDDKSKENVEIVFDESYKFLYQFFQTAFCEAENPVGRLYPYDPIPITCKIYRNIFENMLSISVFIFFL